MNKTPLNIYWTTDCGGKRDYDSNIVCITSRYWPPGYNSNGKHSAKSTLSIRNGNCTGWREGQTDEKEGDRQEGDYCQLTEQAFEGDSKEEVYAQVEKWAEEKYNEVIHQLLLKFPVNLEFK